MFVGRYGRGLGVGVVFWLVVSVCASPLSCRTPLRAALALMPLVLFLLLVLAYVFLVVVSYLPHRPLAPAVFPCPPSSGIFRVSPTHYPPVPFVFPSPFHCWRSPHMSPIPWYVPDPQNVPYPLVPRIPSSVPYPLKRPLSPCVSTIPVCTLSPRISPITSHVPYPLLFPQPPLTSYSPL